jgi:hypothetical protein
MKKEKQATNRSDKIRARRNQKKQVQSKPARDRKDIQSRSMPPVMVRNSDSLAGNQKRKNKKKSRVKRRYDISLPTPGVEIRLPSFPVIKIGWRVVSFSLVVGLVWILNFLLTSPMFQVHSVELIGAWRLSVDEIARNLNLYDKPIFVLDPQHLEKELAVTFAELTDISVQIGLPAQVLINVNERVPMITWIYDSDSMWIDGNGYVFEPRGDVEKLVVILANSPPPLSTPVATEDRSLETNLNHQGVISPEFIEAVFTLKSKAPEGTDLIYDAHHGLGWKDPQGWDVFFGLRVDNIQAKLLVYESIVDRLLSEDLIPALIDVEHVHAPYYRMEQ